MNGFIDNAIRQFSYYKLLGDKSFEQLNDVQLFYAPNNASNSIAVIAQHLHGNMMSRWTDFLNSDGEKDWRDRDAEFDSPAASRGELLKRWNEGWDCLFNALRALDADDLQRTVYIRNQGHSVQDAIVRQLAHYPYHIGQIVFIAKLLSGDNWKSLSIPKNGSKEFNAGKFAQPKHNEHFTDEALGGTEKGS